MKRDLGTTFFIYLFIAFCIVSCRSKSESSNAEVTNKINGISIHEAALNCDLDRITFLLEHGSNVDSLDIDGRTALMYAAYNGHTNVISKLIERNAAINLQDYNGRTALMMAASGPFTDAVKLLLDNGADLNITDKEEHFTALMFASSEGQTEVVKLLLARNADISLKDIDGEDALTFARKNNHPDVVAVLQSYMKKK